MMKYHTVYNFKKIDNCNNTATIYVHTLTLDNNVERMFRRSGKNIEGWSIRTAGRVSVNRL